VPLLLTRHETRERVPRGPSFAWSSEHCARVFISLGWPDPRRPLKPKAGLADRGVELLLLVRPRHMRPVLQRRQVLVPDASRV
jgi:hypothetical protein